jgi:uncharacterized protein YkwD
LGRTTSPSSLHLVTPFRKLKCFFREAFHGWMTPVGPPRRRARRRPLLLEPLETRQLLSGYAPTGLEQEFLERLNDARANPAAYGQSIGLDLSGVAPSQPLAFNTALVQSSRDHSTDMNVNNFFGHNGSDGSTPFQRMSADGFPWVGAEESIAAGYPSPEAALQALIVDSGVPSLGHRDQLLSIGGSPYSSEQETGVGIVLNGTGSYHNYYTIDSGNTANSSPFLTGVVYNDLNHNGVYDAGEGLGGVTITAGSNQTTTWGSGGFSLRVNPGTYTVTASGGGLGTMTQAATVGSANYRLNFLASLTPPTAPTGLAAVGGSHQVTLSWADVSGENGYMVERSPDGVSGWAQVGTTGANVTTYQDTGLSAGATYTYRVRAYNAAGNSPYSTTAQATTSAPNPPGAVGSLTAAAASSSQVNLSWSDVSGETGFKVERSADGQTGWTQIGTTGANVTTYQDTGLSASTPYYYRVRASNADGDGGYSPTASAITAASGAALFTDNFNGPSLNPAWRFVGGSWAQAGGVLAQTSTANADPRKALISGQSYPADVAITARVRVDSWSGGDFARAGVGLYTDPVTGQGYNLVFHNNTNTVQFLNDGVVWGNSYAFTWQVGVWYWFKLQERGGVLYGKVWADGTAEPAAWMFQQSGWTGRNSSGLPALNGGSALNGSNATASFDDVTVTNAT